MAETKSALGFRVKSGWAAAVLLAGPAESPQLVDRRIIQLRDPAVPESKQPYHAGMGILQTDEKKVERLQKVIVKAAQASVADWIKFIKTSRHQVRQAKLVVGSDIDPARIGNPHIRAHALEGRLFRTVLADALDRHGISSSIILEREAYKQGAEILKRSEKNLKRALTDLGKSLDGSWQSNDKLASLASWIALVERI
jgi:hypothetical protein